MQSIYPINKKKVDSYIVIIISAFFIILSFLIVRPFITALISAFVLAFLIKPIYNFLIRKIPGPVAGIISLLVALCIFLVPIAFIVISIAKQAASLATNLNGFAMNNSSAQLNNSIISFDEAKGTLVSAVAGISQKILSSIPSLAITLIIMFFATYYILRNWNTVSRILIEYLPFKAKQRIAKEMGALTKNIVYGHLLIGLIEFIVAFIGFYLSGVQAYLVLPLIIAIFAFIPGLGPIAVWLPTALYYIFFNEYGTAIGVIITGLILTLFIETILLAKIIGKKSEIHPFIFLIGIIGGIFIFGFFGFIVGPIVLVYTIKLIKEAVRAKA